MSHITYSQKAQEQREYQATKRPPYPCCKPASHAEVWLHRALVLALTGAAVAGWVLFLMVAFSL